MKKFISYIGLPFASITSNNDALRSGSFKYPIISSMMPDENEHIEIINLGDSNTNFDDIRNDVVSLGIIAGYTNIILDGETIDCMNGLFEYVVNNTSTEDELFIDISSGNRYIKFALIFATKYLSVVKGINCTIVSTVDDTSFVDDITSKYINNSSIMDTVSGFLKNIGIFGGDNSEN